MHSSTVWYSKHSLLPNVNDSRDAVTAVNEYNKRNRYPGTTTNLLVLILQILGQLGLLYAQWKQEDMLREHKPRPIWTIRISDFGLPDPKRDPDRHKNCITWSLSHSLPLQKISSKSVHKFVSNPTDRQTDKQTDRQTDKQTELKT